MVARDTPKTSATAATEIVGSRNMARAFAILFGVSALGLPPFRPRANAALRPARVRWRIISRSNSAKAAVME